jgi:hypothetical protein
MNILPKSHTRRVDEFLERVDQIQSAARARSKAIAGAFSRFNATDALKAVVADPDDETAAHRLALSIALATQDAQGIKINLTRNDSEAAQADLSELAEEADELMSKVETEIRKRGQQAVAEIEKRAARDGVEAETGNTTRAYDEKIRDLPRLGLYHGREGGFVAQAANYLRRDA